MFGSQNQSNNFLCTINGNQLTKERECLCVCACVWPKKKSFENQSIKKLTNWYKFIHSLTILPSFSGLNFSSERFQSKEAHTHTTGISFSIGIFFNACPFIVKNIYLFKRILQQMKQTNEKKNPIISFVYNYIHAQAHFKWLSWLIWLSCIAFFSLLFEYCLCVCACIKSKI